MFSSSAFAVLFNLFMLERIFESKKKNNKKNMKNIKRKKRINFLGIISVCTFNLKDKTKKYKANERRRKWEEQHER